jgi:thioredoxin reductase (NADPH)
MAVYDLRAIAFPKLDEKQIAALAHTAQAGLMRYEDGATLFQAGDRDFKFFVVQAGEIEILDPTAEPARTVTVHGPGEFTGDVSHLTGTPSVVTAIARKHCEAYEVSTDALRRVVNRSPALGDIILQAFIARRQLLRESGDFKGLRVIGSRYSKDTFRVRDFLAKNRVLFTWLDLETDPEVNLLLKRFELTDQDTPVVAFGDKLLLRNPSNRELADALGLRRLPAATVHDLVIVGAGPAGLAAAVYGASEGLDTVVLERVATGGQAGSSMRIENYLGFPTGITGSELADRAVLQANKFGAHLSVMTAVVGLNFENVYSVLALDDGASLTAKCLLIASGAEYQRLPAEGCARFEGCGVYYAATMNEAQLCRGMDAVIVGGGNSAGQAAVFLAGNLRKVFLVVRGGSLYERMSSYLAQRIEQTENIEVLLNSEVKRMAGDAWLQSVEIVNNQTGETRTLQTAALFSFVGAVPRTDWLAKQLRTDQHGFVLTGALTGAAAAHSSRRADRREPFFLETSRPGVFAAGDVRSGSVKRVASAVGEGAMAVQFVHGYLQTM